MGSKQTKGRNHKTLIAGLAVAATAVFGTPVAMSDPQEDTVRMGVPAWPGVEIKSAVVERILDPLGYTVKTEKASAPIIYRGLADGSVDINMSAWSPGQRSSFGQYVEDGSVLELAENLRGATAGFAVPEYVYEDGLQSDTRIAEYAERFDRKVYCIDPGSGANEVVNTAIEDDVYGMGDWEIVASSTSGMLSQVEKAMRDEEWIMFCGWRPHWMNVIHDMKYLQDPQDLWGPNGGESRVFTLANADFPDVNPELGTFFERFQVDSSVQSEWIYQYAYNEREAEAVAEEWISENLETVTDWVDGVGTVDGGDAVARLESEYGDG
jgi:glycine betaine/proline transport system substrate-binding protein